MEKFLQGFSIKPLLCVFSVRKKAGELVRRLSMIDERNL